MSETLLTVVIGIIIVAVLAVDLLVFHRKAHQVSLKEAIGWSIFWIIFALAFNVALYYVSGREAAVQFLSGYLVEKSLSVDNLFVFLLIFTYFDVPTRYQHKVLFWGIVGALVMRGILIGAGLALVETYHWMNYVLGAFLILTGAKTAFSKAESEATVEHNPVLRLLRKFLPLTREYKGSRFYVTDGKRVLFTPLFVVLIVIETTDVMFALDSIPAILAITRDPVILYSSNLFAILGLRALYFVLVGLLEAFRYLSYGVALVLMFVGAKMMVSELYHVPEMVTLAVIGSILGVAALASFIARKREIRIGGDKQQLDH